MGSVCVLPISSPQIASGRISRGDKPESVPNLPIVSFHVTVAAEQDVYSSHRYLFAPAYSIYFSTK